MFIGKFRRPWQSAVTKELALNATIARVLALTDIERANYGPFVRAHIENLNATVTLELGVGGNALGDNTVVRSIRTYYLPPGSAIDILPEEDDLQFTQIAIRNTHAATNTANDDIVWSFSNF